MLGVYLMLAPVNFKQIYIIPSRPASGVFSCEAPETNLKNVTFGGLKSNNNFKKKVFESISQANLIGEGLNSKVYKFTDTSLDKYVIKVLKNEQSVDKPILNVLPKFNFGQAVLKIQENIYILKKVEGVVHGLNIQDGTPLNFEDLTPELVDSFLSRLERIAQFPQESYDRLAEKVKYLSDNNYKLDSINPNNVLVDYDNREINIIDAIKHNQYIYDENCSMDITASILDFRSFKNLYDFLPERYSENETIKYLKEDLLQYANIVDEKTKIASQKAGLSTDNGIFNNFTYKVAYIFGSEALKNQYDDFISLYRSNVNK